jgi:hypothetical protein
VEAQGKPLHDDNPPSATDVTLTLAGSCLGCLILLPLLPFQMAIRGRQYRLSAVIRVKARLVQSEDVDHLGWRFIFEVYGKRVMFEAGKVDDPPPNATVGILSYRAWRFISFEPSIPPVHEEAPR